MVEVQYTIKLPPRDGRPSVRRIRLQLTVPDGNEHTYYGIEVHSNSCKAKTIDYYDEYNDWLDPIFKQHSEYGFDRAAKVTVEFKLYLERIWTRDGIDGLKAWVMGNLLAETEVADRLKSGMLKLEFPEL